MNPSKNLKMQSTVGSNEKDMNATEQDTYINLTVKLHGYGSTLFYRINRSSQFKKLMTDYSDRYSRELELVIFLFGRGHIEEEQTPNELHMKDGDIIDTTFRYGANINLKIKGQDGYEASFEMHYNSRLEKLMDFYCRKYCLEVTEVAFLFNGRLLRADQTPWKFSSTSPQWNLDSRDKFFCLHQPPTLISFSSVIHCSVILVPNRPLHMRYEVEIYAVFYDQIAHIELKQKSQFNNDVGSSR
ncbi:small ubiquitin-related modifier [Trifolium repens]|nr:small ubiquitin-related modifier [Trifolium repens]